MVSIFNPKSNTFILLNPTLKQIKLIKCKYNGPKCVFFFFFVNLWCCEIYLQDVLRYFTQILHIFFTGVAQEILQERKHSVASILQYAIII